MPAQSLVLNNNLAAVETDLAPNLRWYPGFMNLQLVFDETQFTSKYI